MKYDWEWKRNEEVISYVGAGQKDRVKLKRVWRKNLSP